jgi:TonB family protein
MKRTQRLLLIAVALSLLVHAIVALILHPPTADFQNPPEVVSILRRSTSIAVARATPPPPRPTHTPSQRNLTQVKRRARTGAPAPSQGGTGRSRATPAPALPPPPPTAAKFNGACAAPNAAAAVVDTPPAPDIPASVRADATSGTAQVAVALDATGQIVGANVAQSTGNSSLDLVAVAMARAARYSAALHDCKPIAGSATFSVKFVAW